MTFLRNTVTCLFFAGLAVLWTYPLAFDSHRALPGAGPGDNLTFLWNLWWFRAAMERGEPLLRTSYLFAPFGTDLSLHTHTALNGLLAATVLAGVPLLTAQNLIVLAHVALTAVCAWRLALEVTNDRDASIAAGVLYGGSPFLLAHFPGHFNLLATWTLPLFALAVIRAFASARRVWAIFAGVTLTITAYCDYYFLVYEGAFLLLFLSVALLKWTPTPRTPVTRTLARTLFGLVALDIVVIAAVLATGGVDFRLGGSTVSMHGVSNPMSVAWLLGLLALWARFPGRIAFALAEDERSGGVSAPSQWRQLAWLLVVGAIGLAPLAIRGLALWWSGDYQTQVYAWRSAPPGIDLATLVLGNPFHPLYGERVRALYAEHHIDQVEQVAWLGIVPIALLLRLWRHRRSSESQRVRLWLAVLAVFGIWSLGPWLRVLGHNTGLALPGILLRFVPVIANARMPGRAMAMVYLALAVLIACALAQFTRAARRRVWLPRVAAAVIAIDYLGAPVPTYRPTIPEVYRTLAQLPRQPSDVVCELPMGIRDGFGEEGLFDPETLYYQTLHEQPITGGFVARLSPRLRAQYERTPVLADLLRLSGGAPATITGEVADRRSAAQALHAARIRFVVLDTSRATPSLIDYVHRALPLRLIVQRAGRELYVVD
jgi:hypothetical protein